MPGSSLAVEDALSGSQHCAALLSTALLGLRAALPGLTYPASYSSLPVMTSDKHRHLADPTVRFVLLQIDKRPALLCPDLRSSLGPVLSPAPGSLTGIEGFVLFSP